MEDYEIIMQRIIEGKFPVESIVDHKCEVSTGFFREIEDKDVDLEKLIEAIRSDKISSTPIGRAFLLKRFFKWIPFNDEDLKPYRKNSKTCIILRDIGRVAVSKRNLKEALKYYNLACLFGRFGYKKESLNDRKVLDEGMSKEFLETMTERAEILLQARGGEEALRDVNFLLGLLEKVENYDNPTQFAKSLMERLKKVQAKCLNFIEDKACFMMELAKDSVEEMEKRCKYKNILLFKVKKPHAQIPAAESFVEIRKDPMKGRCLVLNRDIPAGTTVVVEEPFVKVLKEGLKFCSSHCHYCLVKIRGGGGIPCQSCVFEMYCSDWCRNEAYAKYHRWECPCLPYLHLTSTPRYIQLALRIICILGPKEVYRMFVTKDPKYFLRHEDENEPAEILGFTPGPDGIYDSASYLPIYHLVLHPPKSDIEYVTNVIQALIFAQVLDILSTFFDQPRYLETHPREYFLTFVAALILHHMENIPPNSISVDELHGLDGISLLVKEPTTLQERIRAVQHPQVGSAVYAVSSLINHSCDPNVTRIHDLSNGRMALVALKGLKAGEELYTSYTKIFLSDTTDERREYLENTYNFTCSCIACTQRWPILAKISETEPRFICSGCTKKLSVEEKAAAGMVRCILDKKGSCRNCRKVTTPLSNLREQLEQKIESFFEAYELILKNKPLEAIRLLGPCAQFFQENVCPPYNKIYMSQDLLKTALDLVVHYSVPRT